MKRLEFTDPLVTLMASGAFVNDVRVILDPFEICHCAVKLKRGPLEF
jgi:hypothetical protein